jgi:enoyl-CoA hydratase
MAPVLFSVDERGVATITLNRPERLNSINLEMRDLLWEYLAACREIEEVQVIIFRGEGRCFSAGADISEFGTAPSIMAARESRHRRDLWSELLHHRCLSIAAMHGYCFGARLELPLCCDLRLAEDGATFALPEVTLGYIPSAGGTQTLPRLVPPGIAASMILTGEPVDCESALRWGLIDEIAPAGALTAALEARIATVLPEGIEPFRKRRTRMLANQNAAAAASLPKGS